MPDKMPDKIDIEKLREKWTKLCRFTGPTEATDDIFALLDELADCKQRMAEAATKLAAIAESPCAMGGPDIDRLHEAIDLLRVKE